MNQMQKAASLALRGFDTDDLRAWTQGLEACSAIDTSPLGERLHALRKSFWHEGTYAQRERCAVAACKLRFRLAYELERKRG